VTPCACNTSCIARSCSGLLSAATGRCAYSTPNQSAAKGALVKAYLSYLLSDGQDLLPDLDYAKLPDEIKSKAVAQLDQIKVG